MHPIPSVGVVDIVGDLWASGVGIIGSSAVTVMNNLAVAGLGTANIVKVPEGSLVAMDVHVEGVTLGTYAY